MPVMAFQAEQTQGSMQQKNKLLVRSQQVYIV